MVFSSMFFMCVFLPVVFILHCVLPGIRMKNALLLLASVFFYAYGEPVYIILLFISTLLNYFCARLIEGSRYKKGVLILAVICNLGILIVFKYTDFILGTVNGLLGLNLPLPQIRMPIGISFFTFQAMSYVIDVYRGTTKAQKNYAKVLLYISFFPQLIAGPIVKYHDVAEQISCRTVTFDKVAYGVKRFIIGLAKKMLIANTLGAVADKIFAQPVEQFDTLTAWIGAIAYTLQLYYDFSGYSDMAIGLGSIFGFKFLENFNYPYISKSITEFWRRWHISLSTWFKEYLYIPLGGNRVSQRRNLFNLFVVFLATGIWHGASWNFVFWGLWHGIFIIFEKITGWHKRSGGLKINIAQHLYTIFAFVIGWVMFRADNMAYACEYIKNMFGLIAEHQITYKLPYYIDNIEIIAFTAAVFCAMPLFKGMLDIKYKHKVLRTLVNVWLILLFVLSSAEIAASTYNPFIYFRF